MILGKVRPPQGDSQNSGTGLRMSEDLFRRQILTALAFGVTGCLLVFLLPAYYFISQNYQIFLRLASDVRPGLMAHLERELSWLFFFLLAGGISVIAVTWAFASRLSRGLIHPIQKIENRLKGLALESTAQPDEELPNESDYRSLVLSFNDLNRSLIQKTREDLEILEKLNIDPARREAHSLWLSLINRKRRILGLSENDGTNVNAEESSEVVPLRRVS